MAPTKYNKELEVAVQLAREAGDAIMDVYYGTMETQVKADRTLVTNADFLANERIMAGLEKHFPRDGIVSEEAAGKEGERVWYIDPLDGTSGFTRRSDQFSVHVGLTVDEHPVLGIVYKPTTRECYYAVRGHGAYRSNPRRSQRLLVSPPESRLRLIMDNDIMTDPNWQPILRILQPDKVLTSGSEGLRIMKVAEGIADIHTNSGPTQCSTWDLCAPQMIAEEAGAYVAFTDGSPITYHQQTKMGKMYVIAASKNLGLRVADLLNEHFSFANVVDSVFGMTPEELGDAAVRAARPSES